MPQDIDYRSALAAALAQAPSRGAGGIGGGDPSQIERIEELLKAIAGSDYGATDDGSEGMKSVAKAYGARPPWHRDFNSPPADLPEAEMSPEGYPRPFRRR